MKARSFPPKTWAFLNRQLKGRRKSCLILILANMVLALLSVAFALLSKGMIDGALHGGTRALLWAGTLFLAVLLVTAGVQAFCRQGQAVVQGKLEAQLRESQLQTLLSADHAALQAYHTGALQNRLFSDIQVVSGGISQLLPQVAGLGTRTVTAFLVLFRLNPGLTLVFATAGLTLFAGIRLGRNRLKKQHQRLQRQEDRLRAFIQELLENLLVVRSFRAEGPMLEKSARLQAEYIKEKRRKSALSVSAGTGLSLTLNLSYLLGLAWCAGGLQAGTLTMGTLMATLQLISQVQSPFMGLSGLFTQYYSVQASAERLMEMAALPAEPAGTLPAEPTAQKLTAVTLQDLSFQYPGSAPILDHVTQTLPMGSRILLTGPSGAGKSTLLKLLLGVLRPSAGTITCSIQGQPPQPASPATRPFFAYVPQGSPFLAGTIRENLTWFNPGKSETALREALKASEALAFVDALPQGLDTPIGEKGQTLSEGQRQRLTIARALLSEAPILLLDEATSALDAPTERKVLENLQHQTRRTCLLVTHQTAARSICSQEWHLEAGTLQVLWKKEDPKETKELNP